MTRHGAGADGDDGASGEALDLNAIVSMTFKDGDHVDVAHSLGMFTPPCLSLAPPLTCLCVHMHAVLWYRQ